MPRQLYVEFSLVGMLPGRPADMGVNLYINGVDIHVLKYGLYWNPFTQRYDYYEFAVSGATFNEPDNFSDRIIYQTSAYTIDKQRWENVLVDDDFAIPQDLFRYGRQLSPLFDETADGDMTAAFLLAPDDPFDFLFEEAKPAIWELADDIGDYFGIAGLGDAMEAADTIREAIYGIYDDAERILEYGIGNIDRPDFDPAAYHQQVDALMSNSLETTVQAFLDLNDLGDEAEVAFSLARVIADWTEASDGLAQGSITHDIGADSDFHGTNHTEVVLDGGGSSRISGGAGNDILYGGVGNDLIADGPGSDFISGGAGDDLIQAGADGSARDFVSGGAGFDTLHIGSSAPNPFGGGPAFTDVPLAGNIHVNFQTGAVASSDAASGIQTYVGGFEGIERVVAGNGDDTIVGDGGANVIDGGAGSNWLRGGDGDDQLYSGGGIDRLEGGNGWDFLNLNRTNASAGIILRFYQQSSGGTIGLADGSSINGMESLRFDGSAFDDQVWGGDGVDDLYGAAGADSLYGRGSTDKLVGGDDSDYLDGGSGADIMHGGAGDDTYVVDNAGDDPQSSFWEDDDGFDTVISSVSFSFVGHYESKEALVLSGSDAIDGTGNSSANILTGNVAANILSGNGGNDQIAGNGGNDTLNGGSGSDTLNGGTGRDTMAGGSGDDTYLVDRSDDVTAEAAGQGIDTVMSVVSHALGANLENLTLTGTLDRTGRGNSLANILTGNSGANDLYGAGGADTLQGNAGNDLLDGGTGGDVMSGGSGDDLYKVDNAGDTVSEEGGDGLDLVKSSVSFTLAAGLENLILTGTGAINGTGNDLSNAITGNSLANVLTGHGGADQLSGFGGNDTLNGGDDNDTLNGGAGRDTMAGGAGDDIYQVDRSDDVTTEGADEGVDTVLSSVTHVLKANVENLTLTGFADRTGKGNGLANILTGNSGANELYGLDGADELIGNGGNDLLDGGTGADAMSGGMGDDLYVVDDAGDSVSEEGGTGVDLVKSSVGFTLAAGVDNLTLTGTAAIDGTGNDLDNFITGNSSANVLTGGAGADQLSGFGGDDVLDGSAGRDSLTGGLGGDTFRFDALSDFAGLDQLTCDLITLFSQAEGDRIDLSGLDADTLADGDQAFAFIGTAGFGGNAGELRYEQSGGDTYVTGDLDGDAQADFMIKLGGTVALQGSDFGL